jgi:hypothetical protein
MKFVKLFATKIRLWLTVSLVVSISFVYGQTTPSDAQSKTKFADKIGHWLYAYGMSSPDFLPEDRAAFKEKAFAEVYVEATINYDAWMFNLLNKVTQFRYPAKQMPHIIFEVKFTPTDATLTAYNIGFAIQATSEVSVNLQNIANEAAADLSGKTYTEPAKAVEDIEKAIKAALNTLADKLGDELAPNLLVRYANEVFWNGHEIGVMEGEGNYVELEAVDKTGAPINPSQLTWTNADPFESKGVVDMTGVNAKEVTLVKTGEERNPLRVMVKRVGTSEDINELLKMLIVEVLAAKKQQARDTIVVLRQDSTTTARNINEQLALLEAANLKMENSGVLFSGLYDTPPNMSVADTVLFHGNTQRSRGFEFLKKRRRLSNTIRKKINLVAFADLVVDNPEKLKDLLNELLTNSGRLVARIILNKDSKAQKDNARNIVIDFLNQNLEQIVGRQYPESARIEPPLPPVVVTVTPPTYAAGQQYYISPYVDFEGKEQFEVALRDYLSQLSTPVFVTVNYSQDVSTASYVERSRNVRPAGLPPQYKYVTFTLVNIPGSIKFQIAKASDLASTAVNATGKLGEILLAETQNMFGPPHIGVTTLPAEICNDGNGSATFLSPAGTLVILPAVGVTRLTFFHGFNTLDQGYLVPGTLLRFTIGEKTFTATGGLTHSGYRSADDHLYDPAEYIKHTPYIDAGKKYFTMFLPCGVNDENTLNLVRFKIEGGGVDLPVDDGSIRETYTVSNFPIRLFSQFKEQSRKSYPLSNLPSILDISDVRQQLTEEGFDYFEFVCNDETIIPRFKGAEYLNLHPVFVHEFTFNYKYRLMGSSTYDHWLEYLKDLDHALRANQNNLETILTNLPNTLSTMTNLQFEELMRMMSITDFENLSLANRILLLRRAGDFESSGLGDKFLRNLIVHTPENDQRALMSALVVNKTFKKSEIVGNKESLLQTLIRDDWGGGIDGAEFTQTITTLTSWALRHSPAPSTFSIENALNENKFIRFNEGVWFGDLFTEEFTADGNIFLSAEPQVLGSTTKVKARPFEYIYIRFEQNHKLGVYEITKGEEIKLPALYAYMLFNNQNTERIHVGARLAFDVAFLALGVGEVNLALRARNSWRLYKAIADVGISIADIGINNALKPYVENSPEGKLLLSHWNTFMLFYAVGAVGEAAYTAALNNMRYTADEIVSRGALIQEDASLRQLSAAEKQEIDNMVKNAEQASGLKANPLLATVRTDIVPKDILKQVFGVSEELALRLSRLNNIDNIYKNPGLMSRINSLGGNKNSFLEDLTNTTQYYKPPISERIADLDEQMIDVWEIMATQPGGYPRKRLSYDYLNENKHLSRDEILQDLAGTNSREVLATSIETTCPGCAEAIRQAGTLNTNIKRFIIPKILAGEVAANGMKWEDIYLHFIDDASRLRYVNPDTRVFDWELFFSAQKFQAHHYFPVNLFADDAGAFRFMFEKIPSSKKQQLADFFNSQQNGILVPNKRVVNGEEYVIHTNHHDYELRLSEYLNAKRTGYVADGLADDVIAELLYEDVLSVNLQGLIIEKSLLGNTNINELGLSDILKP